MGEDRVKECLRENDVHFTVLLGLISVPYTQQWEKDKRRSERKLTKVFAFFDRNFKHKHLCFTYLFCFFLF